MNDDLLNDDVIKGVGEISVLNTPIIKRRMIAVVDQSDMKAVLANSFQGAKKRKRSRSPWASVSQTLDRFLLSSNILSTSIELAEAIDALRLRIRPFGKDVLPVSPERLNSVSFPPGHPRIGGVYVVHPANPDIYYPVADFHRLNFETKISEATALLMALGANSLSVNHVTGWGRGYSAQMAAQVVNSEASANLSKKTEFNKDVIFTAELSGSDNPQLPDKMIWFDHEPTWQTVAEGRLQHGMTTFNLSIAYNDDFGVNASLKTSIQNSGLQLSGEFTEHSSTVWTMSGRFGAR